MNKETRIYSGVEGATGLALPYSGEKVASLLGYTLGVDHRLPEIPPPHEEKRPPNPYVIYYQIMSMSGEELQMRFGISPENFKKPEEGLLERKELVRKVCLAEGISPEAIPFGYGIRHLRREVETVAAPLSQGLRGKISGDLAKVMVEEIFQRYRPESAKSIQGGTRRIAGVFGDLFLQAKRYGFVMPKDRQLITFFSQIAQQVFAEEAKPLQMIIVACPRYGEFDEYDRLEEGLSYTARTYLEALPLLTSVLARYSIPYQGHILINDTEENMADGSLLQRLGLTREIYRQKCASNVQAIEEALRKDEGIKPHNISAHLFTEVFPEFMETTKDLERQLFSLIQQDSEFRLAVVEIAKTRLERHKKIMGGDCDFSDSFYLALHYLAEYMVLGYLCRLHPELNGRSFIVNYNSPNVEYFNNKDLLAKSVKGELQKDSIVTVPVFEVKFY